MLAGRAFAGIHSEYAPGPQRSGPASCWCRSWTSCSRCRSWVSFPLRRVLHVLARARARREFASIFASSPAKVEHGLQLLHSLRTFRSSLRRERVRFGCLVDAVLAVGGAFAMPALIWNMMMSMSGGCFRRRSKNRSGRTPPSLCRASVPTCLAFSRKPWRIAGRSPPMLIVILLYDQLLFRRWWHGRTFPRRTGTGVACPIPGRDHDARSRLIQGRAWLYAAVLGPAGS